MGNKLKKYLLTGLLVWLPLAITVWVLAWLLGTLNSVFLWFTLAIGALVPGAADFFQSLRNIPGFGVLVVVLGLLLTGMLATNLLGQWLLRQWDALFQKIPVVRSIYTSVKQVSDTLFSSSGNAFSKVLLIQYPRAGIWTIAFLTGRPSGEFTQHVNQDLVSVYVPTTPNPTSGFFLMLPQSDVVELNMSVDEALKYVISMGVVAPPVHVSVHAPAAASTQPY